MKIERQRRLQAERQQEEVYRQQVNASVTGVVNTYS